MIPITMHFVRKGTGFDAKTWRAILKVAWQRAGEFWFRTILPKHFTRDAISEYHYAARTAFYSRYKGKKFGHQLPLVFRGQMRSEVLAVEDVRADSLGVRDILHGPRYLYQYRKRLNDPDKAKELSTFSEADGRAVGHVLDEAMQDAMEHQYTTIDITAGNRAA
jgi:predicted DsbA family dithiol-disulfide isomerase